ncbi:hypothetical protein, partial [Pontibacter liquoris]|uniref:hypothetical protein n=1 Tax=Pontibacter liquoris TaxID=2905677 RepID=UPI001FA7B864
CKLKKGSYLCSPLQREGDKGKAGNTASSIKGKVASTASPVERKRKKTFCRVLGKRKKVLTFASASSKKES